MGGYVRSLADEELRVRAGQGFVASQNQSAGANPAQAVLFNPATSTIRAIVNKIIYTVGGTSGCFLSRLAADPGFGAVNTPSNRLFGSPITPQCLHEGAVAASPATVGQIGNYQLNLGASNEVLAPAI